MKGQVEIRGLVSPGIRKRLRHHCATHRIPTAEGKHRKAIQPLLDQGMAVVEIALKLGIHPSIPSRIKTGLNRGEDTRRTSTGAVLEAALEKYLPPEGDP